VFSEYELHGIRFKTCCIESHSSHNNTESINQFRSLIDKWTWEK